MTADPTSLPDPMARALQLATGVLGLTSPNPAVGCVLIGGDGTVIGEGATQPVGGPHAEIMALRDAAARGHDTRGASAYVTLEPCAHHGRTGPCCDALIAAGVTRVTASLGDPNPLVAGQGFARLRAAGVQVEVGAGAQQAREINLGFLSRITRQRPWVRLKVAASLDGRTALPDGTSQWITGPAARADGHRWRARASAILTGIGTLLADDPALNARPPEPQATPHQPLRVIVDSQLRTPATARTLTLPGPVLIYTANADTAAHQPLQAAGAEVALLPDTRGRVDLAAMLQDLARRGTNELHVEAGRVLNGALLNLGLVDELLVYLAPKLLGQGLGMAQLAPLAGLAGLADVPAFAFTDSCFIGDDLRLLARRPDALVAITPAGDQPGR